MTIQDKEQIIQTKAYQKDMTTEAQTYTLQPAHKIDISKALQLRLLGQTYREIAKVFNVTHSAVYQAIKDLLPDTEGLQAYKDNKADFFDAHAFKILSAVTEDKIQGTPAAALVTSASKLNEMARLERHEPTDIVETRNLSVSGDLSAMFK